MVFAKQMKNIFFQQTKLLFAFCFKNFADGFAFVLNNLFIQIEERKMKFFTKNFSPMRFTAAHKTNQEYFHMAPCPPVGELKFEELLLVCTIIVIDDAKERFICDD